MEKNGNGFEMIKTEKGYDVVLAERKVLGEIPRKIKPMFFRKDNYRNGKK